MNDQVLAELSRQKGYQERSRTLFDQSLAQGTPAVAAQQTGEGARTREAAYTADQAVPITPTVAPGLAGSAVQQSAQNAQQARSNTARATNAGYENWLLSQAIKNTHAGQEIGMQSDFAHGSTGLLPLRLQQAQHAGDTLSGIGSGIGLLGSLYGGFSGLSGLSSTAGATGGAASSAVPASFNATPVGGTAGLCGQAAMPNAASMQYNAWR
jgi:hypothetical protein